MLVTWHASTRPETLDFGDAAATRWLGLEVRRHAMTGDDSAVVEFSDGSVTQQWDVSDDDGTTWQVSFRGIYRRASTNPIATP